jgi:hypothetical protein
MGGSRIGYPLQETSSTSYPPRTEKNVRDSDGTIILTIGEVTGGTARTLKAAKKLKKPYLVVDLSQNHDPITVIEWAKTNRITVLQCWPVRGRVRLQESMTGLLSFLEKHSGRVLGDAEDGGSREEEKGLNEKASRSYSGDFNSTWNHPASCLWSKRPHPNSHLFQFDMGHLCYHSVNLNLSCEAGIENQGER